MPVSTYLRTYIVQSLVCKLRNVDLIIDIDSIGLVFSLNAAESIEVSLPRTLKTNYVVL